MFSFYYSKACPCKDCKHRVVGCHEVGKCKSEGITYHEWKATGMRIKAHYANKSPAKERMLRKSRPKWARD